MVILNFFRLIMDLIMKDFIIEDLIISFDPVGQIPMVDFIIAFFFIFK